MNRVPVKRYLRRRETRTQTVKKAIDRLHRMKADKDLHHLCDDITLSDEPSQVYPGKHCTAVNIEPRDSENEVAAVFTLRHEAIHARFLTRDGITAVNGMKGWKHEIEAHEETVRFGEEWLKREKDKNIQLEIQRQIKEEKRSIEHLKTHPPEVE